MDHARPGRRPRLRCSSRGSARRSASRWCSSATYLVPQRRRSGLRRLGGPHPPGQDRRLDGRHDRSSIPRPLAMVGVALLVFPKLALGMSGFETGVAVMPQVRGRRDGHVREARRPDPRHAQAAHHRRRDHELLPAAVQPRHHDPDPAGRVRGAAARPTAARWRTWRTSISARPSAPCTTSRRSPSSGSPAPRRWPGCSTSCRATCRATGWPPSGRARCGRWCWCSWRSRCSSPSWFDADVDDQSGAYATGVLVLMLSASFASTVAVHRRGHRRGARSGSVRSPPCSRTRWSPMSSSGPTA